MQTIVCRIVWAPQQKKKNPRVWNMIYIKCYYYISISDVPYTHCTAHVHTVLLLSFGGVTFVAADSWTRKRSIAGSRAASLRCITHIVWMCAVPNNARYALDNWPDATSLDVFFFIFLLLRMFRYTFFLFASFVVFSLSDDGAWSNWRVWVGHVGRCQAPLVGCLSVSLGRRDSMRTSAIVGVVYGWLGLGKLANHTHTRHTYAVCTRKK